MAAAANQDYGRDDLILVRREDRPEGGFVARVFINNPSKKNALPVEGRALLAKVMTELATEPELRCAVLTGVDGNFLGGANIGQMADFPDHVVAELGSKTTHLACD